MEKETDTDDPPDDRVGCCFCGRRRRRRIAPSTESPNLVEIRPGRTLNIVKFSASNNIDRSNMTLAEPALNQQNGLLENVGIFPDGQTALFFLHGVGGSAQVWKSQSEYFAGLGFDVIVPELIGHGASSAPRNKPAYHFAEIAMDILAVFDRHHKRRNVVIGHSYGSSFATLVAKERENLVTKLVLVSGGGPTPLGPQAGVFQLPICMLSCLKSCIVKRLLKRAFYKTQDWELHESAFHIPTYVLRYIMRGQDWLDGDEEYHESLLVPTLLLYGNHDRLVTIEEEIAMKNTINASQLSVMDSASHMVMMERPTLVNKQIQQFLAVKQWRFTPGSSMNKKQTESLPNGLRQRPNPFYEMNV